MTATLVADIILTATLGIVTAIAAIGDVRWHKIPNKLTMPLFLAGLLFQLIFFQLAGLREVGLGLLAGFLPLFVLWLTGGAGGGDAKLMLGISSWLGFKSVYVLILSTVVVLMFQLAGIMWSLITQGPSRTKADFFDTKNKRRGPDPRTRKLPRFMNTYATPIVVATWLVLFWIHVKPAKAIMPVRAETPATPVAETAPALESQPKAE